MWRSGAQRATAQHSNGSHDYADQDVLHERHGPGRGRSESTGTHRRMFHSVIQSVEISTRVWQRGGSVVINRIEGLSIDCEVKRGVK